MFGHLQNYYVRLCYYLDRYLAFSGSPSFKGSQLFEACEIAQALEEGYIRSRAAQGCGTGVKRSYSQLVLARVRSVNYDSVSQAFTINRLDRSTAFFCSLSGPSVGQLPPLQHTKSCLF